MVHKSDFYKERDNAVYETYRRCIRNAPKPIDIDAVLRDVANSKQPRFWVPARTVYNILRRYIRHRAPLPPPSAPVQGASAPPSPVSPQAVSPLASTPAQQSVSPLVHDILAAFHRLRNKREYRGKSLYFIADFVTAEPTRGFYLSKRRLFDIIRHIRKEKFQQRCRQALTGLQGFERHTLLYGQSPLNK